MSKQVIISLTENKRMVYISAPIKTSIDGSELADALDNLNYLKVDERTVEKRDGVLTVCIAAYTIPKLFSIEKLHDDLAELINLIDVPNQPDLSNEENQ